MPIAHFTVSQVRVAAACPRILYFDAEHTRRHGLKQPSISRIWKTGEQEATACGSLFHAAIEQFNHHALAEPMVRRIVESDADAPRLTQELLGHIYDHHVNRAALFEKTGAQQQAFLAALRCYVGELADILAHARSVGKPIAEVLDEMFGDRRRRVDVTFDVGPADEPVHVTGILDYVFYDWRTTHNRIIDYKLTPPDKHAEDLFQVSLYALMHHVQHRTEPDVGVLYLYPKRQMIEKSWEQVHGERHKVYNLLASMREWVRYDEQTGQGLKPPGEPLYCNVCRWRDQCVERLGPKHEGQRLTHWTDALAAAPCAELPVAAHEPGPVAKAEADEGPTVPAEPPEDALWIGETAARRPVALPLAALPTHVAVIGAAGSGKTWVAKVLAEEAVGQGVPVLALDPQGDLVQLMKPRDPASFAGELRRRYDRFWERAEPRILTPGSSHGIRLCLSPIRLPGPLTPHPSPPKRGRGEQAAYPSPPEQERGEQAAYSSPPEQGRGEQAVLPSPPAGGEGLGVRGSEPDSHLNPDRRREEADGLLSTMAGNLVSLARAGGDADCQRTFLYQVLRRLTEGTADRAVGLADVAAATADPKTVGLDEADRFIKKAEREKLARKLHALLHGPSANLFTGGQPLDLEVLVRPTRPGGVPLNIVYLNALADDDQKQFFVAALAAEVYRWMVAAGNPAGRPQLLFYLDEARDYLPAGGRKPPAKEPLLRLFAQGRKYGVACLICTQSPRSVDYNVFSNCSTKVIGRLESAQDVARVAEWFRTEQAPAWLHGRKGAAASSLVARWPGMPPDLEGEVWTSRCLFSMHEGAWSPERVEQETRASRIGPTTLPGPQ